jgi:transcriptional regulator with XRE-family HTH domain
MKALPKRAHGEEALLFRRGIAGRLRLIVDVVGGKSDLAALMGISRSRLSNWISDDEPNLPSIEPIIRLCDATGCTLDYIFRDIWSGLTADLAERLRNRRAELDQAAQHAPAGKPPLKVITRR